MFFASPLWCDIFTFSPRCHSIKGDLTTLDGEKWFFTSYFSGGFFLPYTFVTRHRNSFCHRTCRPLSHNIGTLWSRVPTSLWKSLVLLLLLFIIILAFFGFPTRRFFYYYKTKNTIFFFHFCSNPITNYLFRILVILERGSSNLRLINGCFTTISIQIFAIFHKTEVQTIILRCLVCLNLSWTKSYDIK